MDVNYITSGGLSVDFRLCGWLGVLPPERRRSHRSSPDAFTCLKGESGADCGAPLAFASASIIRGMSSPPKSAFRVARRRPVKEQCGEGVPEPNLDRTFRKRPERHVRLLYIIMSFTRHLL
jgi:hypothetical protein